MKKDNRLMTQEEFWKKKMMISYLLAIFVFLIHISTYSNYTYNGGSCSSLVVFFNQMNTSSTRVAVPLFFILSGVAFFWNFNWRKYWPKMKKRFYSLVIPYLSWNVISLVFAVVTTLYLSNYFVGRIPFDFSVKNFLETIFLHKQNIPFWFILTLIYYVIFTPVFYIMLKNKVVGIVIILLTIVLFIIDPVEIQLFGHTLIIRTKIPSFLFHDSDSIVHYMIGAYIGMHCFDILKYKNKWLSFICMILFIVCSIQLYFYVGSHGMNLMESIDKMNYIYWFCLILTDCFALYFAFDLVMDHVKFRPFMGHSFWVYALHLNLSAIITKLFFFVTGDRICLSFVNLVLTVIITLVIIELIQVLLKKCCKPLHRILSGARG